MSLIQTLDFNPLIILLLLAMSVGVIYRYMKDTYSVLERLGIPGPKPVWLFGNVLEFKGKNVLKVFENWKQTYGKVYGFYEGFRPGIVVNDVDFAQDILNRYFDKFSIRTSYRPFIYYPDNFRLIEIDGDHWKSQRSVFSKMLNSPNSIKLVIEQMQMSAKTMLQQISEELKTASDGINITSAIDHYVSEGLIRIVLNMNDEKLERYKNFIYDYEVQSSWSASADNEVGGLARLFPALTPLLKFADKKYKDAHETVVKILKEFIDEVSSRQNNNKDREEIHESLFEFLLCSIVPCRDSDGRLTHRELDTEEIIAHTLTLLSEAHPTTTSIIQFILYELACHQDFQDKLYDEIQTLQNKDDISLKELKKMKYFEMIFNETYRHHPIAPGVSRVCTESCTIRGVSFQKGMVVRVMTSPMYMDNSLFEKPDVFLPERFSEESRKECHQYSFLPFGKGPRMCPGQKLAIIKVKIAIINILKHYRLSTCKNTEAPLKETLRPSLTPANGVHIKLTNRAS